MNKPFRSYIDLLLTRMSKLMHPDNRNAPGVVLDALDERQFKPDKLRVQCFSAFYKVHSSSLSDVLRLMLHITA